MALINFGMYTENYLRRGFLSAFTYCKIVKYMYNHVLKILGVLIQN